MDEPDWASMRGAATEENIGDFIRGVGGEHVQDRFPKPQFENADFLFANDKIVIELKTLESEFGRHPEFLKKQKKRALAIRDAFHRSAGTEEDFAKGIKHLHDLMRALYRAPMARIAKKANRQIERQKGLSAIQLTRGFYGL